MNWGSIALGIFGILWWGGIVTAGLSPYWMAALNRRRGEKFRDSLSRYYRGRSWSERF